MTTREERALKILEELNEIRKEYARQEGANPELCYWLHDYIQEITNKIYTK